MKEILLFVVVFGVFFFILRSINAAAGKSLGKKKRCPYCGKYGMNPGKYGGHYRNGKRVSDWQCPFCGNSFTI